MPTTIERAEQLQAGDLLVLTTPMRPTAPLVPSTFPTLTQLEVLRVLPGGGNDGEDVIHVFIHDVQVWTFKRFEKSLAKGLFRVVRPSMNGQVMGCTYIADRVGTPKAMESTTAPS